ncbi:MAG TPA: hypothetical protein VHP31_06815 [Caproicibacter sp.]|nr:hypothetical protein [Caproicibacter sp.]
MKERSEEDGREFGGNGINRLLCASNFEEILESGMLDDESWSPKEMRTLNIGGSGDVRIERR